MGSKGSNTTTTQQAQTYQPNPAIVGAGTQALGMATQAAQAPFQMPAAPVAGFTPFQQQYFNAIQGMQGMAQPYFNTGQGYLQQSAAPVTGQDVAGYYNPMASNVFANLQDIFGQQMMETTGQATQTAGGVGADRIGVAQSQLAKQQGLAAGQTAAGLYQQALQAAEQQKQMEAGAGYGISQMGPAAQAAQLQGIGALGTAGAQQQQLTQAQLNALYQQQLAQIAYPFQTAQYLAGITGGLGPSLGYQQYGTGAQTLPTPSPFAQAAGVGLGGVGLLGATGAFGPSGYLTGTGKGGGVSGPTNLAFDTSGFGGATTLPFGNRGGRVHPFQTGGAADEQASDIPGIPLSDDEYLTPIPHIKTSGANAPKPMDLTPKVSQSTTTGGGKGSGIGSIVGPALTLAKMIPFAAQGGAVSPFDVGQPFQDGGAEDSIWDTLAPVDKSSNLNVRNLFNPQTPPTPFSERFITPQQAPAAVASPLPTVDADKLGLGQDWEKPVDPQLDSGDTTEVSARERAASPFTGSTANLDMPAQSPMGPQPYPDALKRDIGQQATRSPWMALVAAGAQMAQTRGPIGSVIGAGMGAGAKELEGQRKALQSEEDINLKAQHLEQMWKEHLDKYQRETPHELATDIYRQQALAAERWMPTYSNTKEGHPVLYDRRSGRTIDSVTREPIDPTQELISSRGTAGKLQKDAQYLVRVGAAKTEAEAVSQLRHSLLDPSKRATAIANWSKIILANDPSIGGNVDAARRRAEAIVSQDLGGGATAAPTPTGTPGSATNPIPYTQGMKRKHGLIYKDIPGVPGDQRWTGPDE